MTDEKSEREQLIDKIAAETVELEEKMCQMFGIVSERAHEQCPDCGVNSMATCAVRDVDVELRCIETMQCVRCGCEWLEVYQWQPDSSGSVVTHGVTHGDRQKTLEGWQ